MKVLLDKRNGFTVVELMVAVGLFSVVISLAVGAYLHTIRTQRFMTEIMATNDNVSMALEQMARDIRMARQVIVAPPGRDCLLFRDQRNVVTSYNLSDNTIKRGTDCEAGAGSGEAMTGDSVLIEDLSFTINEQEGAGILSGTDFEKVLIEVKVNTKDRFFSEPTTLRTSVSTRKYFGEPN